MPDFWPSSGWGLASGRFPEIEGSLTGNSEEAVDSAKTKLQQILREQVLPHLSSMRSLELLESIYDVSLQPGTAYPKAICNFLLGRFEEGKNLIEQFLSFFENQSTLTTQICKELASLDNEGIKGRLDEYKIQNYKKYRLSKIDVSA